MGIAWEQKGEWHIHGKDCFLWLTTRPSYCDRGNYLVNLHTERAFSREIDCSDSWPRYYFDFDAAKSEIIAWLKTRKQFVEELSKWRRGAGNIVGNCCLKEIKNDS